MLLTVKRLTRVMAVANSNEELFVLQKVYSYIMFCAPCTVIYLYEYKTNQRNAHFLNLYIYIYIYIYMCVCVCVCVFIFYVFTCFEHEGSSSGNGCIYSYGTVRSNVPV